MEWSDEGDVINLPAFASYFIVFGIRLHFDTNLKIMAGEQKSLTTCELLWNNSTNTSNQLEIT